MNQTERDICARLKLFRESVGIGQHEFSHLVGLTRNQLSGVEYSHYPLRYQTAWKIREELGLSLNWLASGRGLPNDFDLDPWPIPSSVQKKAALLSEIADGLRFQDLNSPAHKEREKMWFENQKGKRQKPPNRSVLLSVLKDNLVEWMARVPDERTEDFATEIINCGQNYADRFCKDSSLKISVRARALIWGEMRDDIRKRLPKVESLANKKQDVLDNESGKREDAFVKAKIKSLPELLKAVSNRVSERGKKTALARELGVSRQAVDQWLSGDAKPSAELTFKLLNWVEQMRT
jgi:transcriptional regulator with XRE-family HTH domain